MKVSLNVRKLVDEHGWNPETLADRTGVDLETAQGMYSGQPVEIDMETLSQVSEVLGVLPNEIVTEVEEQQPSASDEPAPRDPDVPGQSPDEIKKTPTSYD